MNVGQGSWDKDIIMDLFNIRDQRCIQNTVIAEDREVDKIYWSNESSGMYSVRSTYRMLQAPKDLWSVEDMDSSCRKL